MRLGTLQVSLRTAPLHRTHTRARAYAVALLLSGKFVRVMSVGPHMLALSFVNFVALCSMVQGYMEQATSSSSSPPED